MPSTIPNAGNTFTPFNTVRHLLRIALLSLIVSQSEAVLSKEAIAYWTSFAAAGNPSTDKESISPAWESFIAPDSSRRRLVLNRGNNTATNSTMETLTDAEMARCRFWMSEEVTAETRV